MSATRIHLPRLTGSEMKRVGLAMSRVVRDSTETGEIVVAEEITSQAQLRYLLREGIFEAGEGKDVLVDRPELAGADMDALRALPDATLGREFARFLDTEGISLAGLRQPADYTEGETESYLMQRIRQSHDLWHVLVGLGTQGHEEVLVHCFSIAQTGFPYSLAIIGLGSVKHMLLEGRFSTLTQLTRGAYRRGRDAEPLLGAYWERHWDQPLDEVRRHFGIVPLN